MSYQVTVKYQDVYRVLEPLRGLKLRGSIQGAPVSKFPLRLLVEALRDRVIGSEEYRDSRVTGIRLDQHTVLVCHFGLDQPDDFCIALEDGDAWERLTRAAHELSKLTRESYTLTLAAIVHALQGIVSGEEEEVEAIEDPDQVIEELLTWLPEYISVTD